MKTYLTNPAEIERFIKRYVRQDKKFSYTLDAEGGIHVQGSVMFNEKFKQEIQQLPVKFKSVTKNFSVAGSSLTTLEGCPEDVDCNFYCKNCERLTSLQGGPVNYLGNYDCSNCPNLTSLNGAPRILTGSFNCSNCSLVTLIGGPNACDSLNISENPLKTLEGAPATICASFICTDLPVLESLKGSPSIIGGIMELERCPRLKNLDGITQRIEGELAIWALQVTDYTGLATNTKLKLEGFLKTPKPVLAYLIDNKIKVEWVFSSRPGKAYNDYCETGDLLALSHVLQETKADKGLFKPNRDPVVEMPSL